jgi:hypothetical protein
MRNRAHGVGGSALEEWSIPIDSLYFDDVRDTNGAVARFTGSESMDAGSWGSAALHPRLYARARTAG